MGRRLDQLALSPTPSSLLLAPAPESLEGESETSPTPLEPLEVPPFHQTRYSTTTPHARPSASGLASKQSRNRRSIDEDSNTPRRTTSSTSSTRGSQRTTGTLHGILNGYSESYIRAVGRLIKRYTIPVNRPVNNLSSNTTWINDEDAPPSLTDRPYFLPADSLVLDLLLLDQPPCFPDAEQHCNRSCLCFAQKEIVESTFVTTHGVTADARRILQNNSLAGIDLGISDGFGNTILHFLAARGKVSHLFEAIISGQCSSIINARNTAGQTFLHALDRSYLSDPEFLCELLLRHLSERNFDVYATDHYGRTLFHLLLADDVPRNTFDRVAASYPDLANHVKRDAFNVTPTTRPGPDIHVHGTHSKAMDRDPPPSLSDHEFSFTSESHQDAISTKSSELVAFVRSVVETPAAEYPGGFNGLHCLAAAPYSGPGISRKQTFEETTGNTEQFQRKKQDLYPSDSSSEQLNSRLQLLAGLLEAGVDPNHYDLNGNTPLMAFTALLPEGDDYRTGPEILNKLITAGAEINARNRRGETALHIAVRCGRKLAVRTLVQNGANVHVRDAAGRSLLEVIEVKIQGISDQDVKAYVHFEACRAWLSGKGHAVISPTIVQEWGLNNSSPLVRESAERTGGHPPFDQPRFTKPMRVSGRAHGLSGRIEEDNDTLFSQSSFPGTSRRDEIDTLNPVSRYSGTSIDFARPLSDVVGGFSRAVLLAMRPDTDCGAATYWSRNHVLPLIRAALKDFGKSAEVDRSVPPQVKCIKLVRHLRPGIARLIQHGILTIDQEVEDGCVLSDPISLQEGDYLDNISCSSSADSNADVGTAEHTIGILGLDDPFTIPTEVLRHFTQQQAFKDLVRTTEQLLQRYHSPKMPLIRRLTSVSLRRRLAYQTCDRRRHHASFNIDWNLREFLMNNYEVGIRQRLKNIIAITGGTSNAQLCTVGEYFKWRWLLHHDNLLSAIERTMLGKGTGSPGLGSRELPISFIIYYANQVYRNFRYGRSTVSDCGLEHFHENRHRLWNRGVYRLDCAASGMARSSLPREAKPAYLRLCGI